MRRAKVPFASFRYAERARFDRISDALTVLPDPTSESALRDLVARSAASAKSSSSASAPKEVNAVALLGIIRFLKGYYLIAVTSSQKVGYIHGHAIHDIKGTEMIHLGRPDKKSPVGVAACPRIAVQSR